MTQSTGLLLEKISISLQGRNLIDVNAHVRPGEVLTVMGPSGSGKSTLLAYIGGFLDPVFEASGCVRSDGIDLTALQPEARRVGILFQDPLLFPHLSVAGNAAFAIPADIRDRRERLEMAERALDAAGLAGFGQRDPDTLSGGQRARVALIRVLLSRPRLLLLDEPFSKLDAALRDQMRHMVFDQATAAALPVVLVTHDHADAQAAGGPIHHVSL